MHVVGQANTITTVSTTTTAQVGTVVTVTATVSVQSPGSGTPFGNVTFYGQRRGAVAVGGRQRQRPGHAGPVGPGHRVVLRDRLLRWRPTFVGSAMSAPATITIEGVTAKFAAAFVTTGTLTTASTFSINLTAQTSTGATAVNYSAPVSIYVTGAPKGAGITGTLTGGKFTDLHRLVRQPEGHDGGNVHAGNHLGQPGAVHHSDGRCSRHDWRRFRWTARRETVPAQSAARRKSSLAGEFGLVSSNSPSPRSRRNPFIPDQPHFLCADSLRTTQATQIIQIDQTVLTISEGGYMICTREFAQDERSGR